MTAISTYTQPMRWSSSHGSTQEAEGQTGSYAACLRLFERSTHLESGVQRAQQLHPQGKANQRGHAAVLHSRGELNPAASCRLSSVVLELRMHNWQRRRLQMEDVQHECCTSPV